MKMYEKTDGARNQSTWCSRAVIFILAIALLSILSVSFAHAAQLVNSYDFTTGTQGWTNSDTNASGYIALTTSGHTITSPNLNLSSYDAYRLVITFQNNVDQNPKLYFDTPSTSLNGARYYFEQSSLDHTLAIKLQKNDGTWGGTVISGITPDANVTLSIDYNRTAGTTTANASWSGGVGNMTSVIIGTFNDNYVRYNAGTISGYDRIRRVEVWNLSAPDIVSGGSGSPNGCLVQNFTFPNGNRQNWNGWTNVSAGYLESTTNNSFLTSPNLNLTNFSKYRVEAVLWVYNATLVKMWPNTPSASTIDPNWFYETVTGGMNAKVTNTTNTFQLTSGSGIPYDVNATWNVTIDCSLNQTNGTVSWSGGSGSVNSIHGGCNNQNYIRFTSGNIIKNYVRLVSLKVYNINSSCVTGSSSTTPGITVTYYLNSSSNAQGWSQADSGTRANFGWIDCNRTNLTSTDLNSVSINNDSLNAYVENATSSTQYRICWREKFEINETPTNVLNITSFARWTATTSPGVNNVSNIQQTLSIGNVNTQSWELLQTDNSFSPINQTGVIAANPWNYVSNESGHYYVYLLLQFTGVNNSPVTKGYSNLYYTYLQIGKNNVSVNNPPRVQIENPAMDTWTNKSFVLTYDAVDDVKIDTCKLYIRDGTGGSYTFKQTVTCGTNQSVTITVGPSSYCTVQGPSACGVEITANDSIGQNANDSRTFGIDYTGPNSTISCNGATCSGNYSDQVNISFTCSDQYTTCGSTAYCLDSNNTCTPNTTYVTPFTVTTTGTSYVRYQSTDVVGNTENTQSQSVTIQKSNPPPTAAIASPTAGTWVGKNFTLTYNVTDDGPGTTCQLYTRNGTTASYTLRRSITCGSNQAENVSVAASSADCTVEGSNACGVQVKITDNASQVATAQNNYSIDLSAPSANVSCNGASCTGTYASEVEMTVSCSDSLSGCAQTLYCVDQANSCAPNITYAGPFVVSTSGTNYVRVNVSDAVGNAQVTSTTVTVSTSSNITIGTVSVSPSSVQQNSPVQISTTVTTSSGTISTVIATVQYPNGTQENLSLQGSGSAQEFSCDFSSGSCGFNGGTANTSGKYYYAAGEFGTFYSPWQATCTQCNISFLMNFGNPQNTQWKAWYDTNNQTLVNERYLTEDNAGAGNARAKDEPGYTQTLFGIPYSTWVNYVITTDWSANKSNLYVYYTNGTKIGQITSINFTNNATNKFFAVENGNWTDHFWFTNFSVLNTQGSSNTWTGTWTKTASAGNYTVIQIFANATDGTSHTRSSTTQFQVTTKTGTLGVILLSPTTDTTETHNQIFNFTINVTCTGGTCGNVNASLDPADSMNASTLANPSNPSDTRTWGDVYEAYLQGFHHVLGNQQFTPVMVQTAGDGKLYVNVPWEINNGSSWTDTCYEQNFKTGANQFCNNVGSIATPDLYCSVTDQFSRYVSMLSMSQNATLLNTEFPAVMHTVNALRLTERGSDWDHLLVWAYTFNRASSTPFRHNDVNYASDGDARLITALWNFYHNPNLSNSLKNDSTLFGTDGSLLNYTSIYCSQYRNHTYVITSPVKNSRVGTGRTIQYWAAAGGNQKDGGISSSEFIYPGYLGDIAASMMACGKNLNDPTYYDYANSTIEQWMTTVGTNGWQPTLNAPRGHDGSRGHYSTGSTPVYSCDADCTGGMDAADAVRFTSLCSNAYFDNMTGNTPVNNELDKLCLDFSSNNAQGYNANNAQCWAPRYKIDGSTYSGCDGGEKGNGLGTYIDIGANPSNIAARQRVILGHYLPSQYKWDDNPSPGCGLVYWSAFSVESLGYSLGYADGTFNGTQGTTSPQSKGLVPTGSGTPFYTNQNNPRNDSCLQGMSDGNSCVVSWEVNATGIPNQAYTFFATAQSSLSSATNSNSIVITIG